MKPRGPGGRVAQVAMISSGIAVAKVASGERGVFNAYALVLTWEGTALTVIVSCKKEK